MLQDAQKRKRVQVIGVCAALLLFFATLGWAFHIPLTASAALPALENNTQQSNALIGGTGATLPYVELEAHKASVTGTILGPSFRLGDLAADGVNRTVVQLTRGQYVEFTLPQAANALNLRYSIPDAPGGGGLNASLSIYINGVKQAKSLQLTSKYSWLYGAPSFSDCNANVWSDSPGGTAHHQFDEVHTLLPQMAAGTTVKFQVDAENTAQWYALDVADFEQVAAPLTKPAGYISVTDAPYNADPTGVVDATTAFQNAVDAGSSQGKGVWIPPGNFLITSHVIVDKVTLEGAGPWYSVLGGAPIGNTGTGVGVYGYDVYDGRASSGVHLANFAIQGQITNRVDCIQDNGIGGSLNNSSVSNIWIEHTKVGLWLDGPFTGLTVTKCRIDSVTADGLNFHRAVSNSSVTQSIIRGTGDDGLAMWSDLNGASVGNSNNSFDHNTIQSVFVANGIAIYGGNANSVTNNRVTNTQYRGGGIMLDYQIFGGSTAPFSGTTTVSNNTIQLVAGFGDQGIQQFGALMFWSANGSINAPFTVSGNQIEDSQYVAISFDGGNPISNIALSDTVINRAMFAFSNKVNTITGSATNVVASGLTVGGLQSCEGGQSWNITLGAGNSGWSPASQICGFPTNPPTPTPTQPPGTTPTPTPTPPPTPTPSPVPGGTLVKAINAGGSSAGSYAADTGYNQGNTFSDTSVAIDTSLVGSPAPQGVWQTCRWNSAFTYTIPGLTAGKSYTLRLDWAELSFQYAGARVFNVAVNGSSVLSNFDVYATVGYKKAVAKTFAATANGSGQIVIDFTRAGADNPFVNGIEVWDPSGGPAPTPTPTPAPKTLVKAINAGGNATGAFVADTGYNQGNAFSDTSSSINTSGVSNAAPQGVWQTCRWNSAFTYTLTGLTAGKSYTLQLDWAELSFQYAGARVFNVAVNGSSVLNNFDVYATAGYKTAIVKQFTVTANSSGQIVIDFTRAGADNPFINGIELYA